MTQERLPIGTYPLWIARLIQKGLRSRLPQRTTILLRGRGPRHHKGKNYVQSLPLKYATHAALYVIRASNKNSYQAGFVAGLMADQKQNTLKEVSHA